MPDQALMLRRIDRWSLQWRMARAWRAGVGERRATVLGAARVLEGRHLEGLRRQPGQPVAEAELYFDGATLQVGRTHSQTVDRLEQATCDGPVALERVADHRRFFGLYFRTVRGAIPLLASQVTLGVDGGGLRRGMPLLRLA